MIVVMWHGYQRHRTVIAKLPAKPLGRLESLHKLAAIKSRTLTRP